MRLRALTILDTQGSEPLSAATSSSTGVESFPLERPRFRVRRRDAQSLVTSLPYFIAGPENRLAAFLAGTTENIFGLGNPLLLVGVSGAGKTSVAFHFAARGATLLGGDEGPVVVTYLPAVEFARRYAEAVDTDDLISFREEIDGVDLLIVDDVHLISTKPAAQDELAARIENRCERQSRPTLATCRRLPTEIRGMRPPLVSRLLGGLTVPLQTPGAEARRVLLSELAVSRGLEVEYDLLDALGSGLAPGMSVRQLDAAVKQLGLWTRMNDSPPTMDAVQAAMNAVGSTDRVPIASIINAVSRYYRLKAADLRSSSRRQRIVRARSLAMYLARRMTSQSLHQIGEHFGGRDHSTVLHAIRKVEGTINQDADLRRAADEVEERIGR